VETVNALCLSRETEAYGCLPGKARLFLMHEELKNAL
jgi:hypothetical protein